MALVTNSIRQKLILTISVFIALILVVIAAGTYSYFRYTTQQLIFDQQFDAITNQAKGLDDNILSAHESLINVAKVAPEDGVSDPVAIQKWLENRTGIRTIFRSGLLILDSSGSLVATIPVRPELLGTSFAHRAYFSNSMSGGQPFISAPFLTIDNRPAIMMTAPIKGKDGSVKGLLCGVIELLDTKGLFGTVRNARIGSTGYLYLFAPDRTMILHPDATRILKQDVKPGANRLFDAALNGFEGSGETVNSKGARFLASFKRLNTTGWILAANYPVEEAYQPIVQFRNYYLMGMLFVLLAVVAMAWRLGVGISMPLEGFTQRILALAKPGADRKQRFESRRADELGALAGAFDRLLDEVQRHEQELSQAMELANAANQAKTMFLASISHELRTPMNGVLGMLELVNESDLNAGQREYIELAQRSAQNLLVLLNDLLDFSKIEAGKMELEYARFKLREALAECLQSLSVIALDKGLDLDLQIDERIPDTLMGDVTRLRQVILNLLGNALKFTRQGGVKVSVGLAHLGADDALLTFSVSDTGLGISQAQQRMIFDAFTQADTSTTRQFGGTGLGLAISSRLVGLMKGTIEVESALGQGSVFRFTVPFGLADEATAPASAALMTGGAAQDSAPVFARLNLLLVEDNPINQKLATTIMSNAGHRVTLAQDGEEAVAQVKLSHFDIILMDIEMPRLDGFGATQAIRAMGIETPIIALTAHAIPGFREKCMAAGMADFLTKPINSQVLRNKLQAVHSPVAPRSTETLPPASIDAPVQKDEQALDPQVSPILDIAAALEMVDGDQEMLLMMLPIVREQIETDYRGIATAMSEHDLPQIKRISHRLKGSVGQVGGVRAQKACALLESAAAGNDNNALPGLCLDLKTELDLLAPAIVEYLA